MKLFRKRHKETLENAWDKYYPKDRRKIQVPTISIYEYFERTTFRNEYETAIDYFGNKISFIELITRIDICARALVSQGVRKGDVVTICLPNTPEAVIVFYAVNKIGAIASMLHPLSSEEEIKQSLNTTNSVFLIIFNNTFKKIENIIDETKVYKIVLVSPKDSMPQLLGLGYMLTNELTLNIETTEKILNWNDFFDKGKKYDKECVSHTTNENDAVILHSGGTTGTPKNIVLTNGNINSIMEQALIIFPDLGVGDNFLSILPMFHCFGLVVNILAPLALGSTITLIPKFDAKRFDKLIRKYNPTVLLGVPTLFEALMTNPYMKNIDLSHVRYVISGGDSLSVEKNKQLNEFLEKHKSKVRVIQGYGMTEMTGPATFGAMGSDKLGSIGIPLPGNKVKILDIETKEEMQPGKIGEICLTGPTLMSRYLNNEKETNDMIKTHSDGLRWIHTGDLGYVDEDGVLFYVQRLKRMIITSGYNVYPSYIEEVLLKNKYIKEAGVIGISHPYKVQVPKAFIVLREGIIDSLEVRKDIDEYCKKNLSNYMIPKHIEYRKDLPKTLVGKINYRELEK